MALPTHVFGVRLWILLYLVFSVLIGVAIFLYWKREQIKRVYYQLRFAEKVIKVIVHYKSGLYKIFWRLVPDKDYFEIQGKDYAFDDKSILKDNDFFSRQYKNREFILIDGLKYWLDEQLQIKSKGRKYPEVHYFYNVPHPIKFDYKKKGVEFSSLNLKQFKENDLFTKLLTLQEQKAIIMLMFVIGIINLVGTMFIISKMMGWIQ